MSEAGAGCDVVAMKLKAEKVGRLSPQRHQILDHQRRYADTLVVYAKTGEGQPRASPPS